MAFERLRSGIPRAFACAALIVILPGAASPDGAPPPGPAYHTVSAARVDNAQAPVIDGDLSDPAWANAAVIDEFHQEQPNIGEPATERTVVRILHDADNLYFAIYAYDETPDEIQVRAMARDGPIFTSDYFRITLDPGQTRRNGYFFQVAASGGRRDGLAQNNTETLWQWNTIWAAEARIVEDGWVAEVMIPFRSVSYDRDQPDWGFDFARVIRRKNESVGWSSYNPTLGDSDISLAGTLTGIAGISQGLGLDVQVYATGRVRHVATGTEGTDISGTAGGNLYYKITPGLTGTLTFNPDFSDSPLDARQVNTTRFSLFIDETRDFFLQDAAAFEFGGRNFFNQNARPFFSRNIGLVDAVPVSIIGGGKLSGEFAGFGVGVLSVVTGKSHLGGEQVLSVARIYRPVLEESRVGIIFTNGDPTGLTDNTLAGVDFQYRDSNLFGRYVFFADAYYERSFSSALGEDGSYGLSLEIPNEPWGGRFRYKEVGEDFDPALGFANRTGVRRYQTRILNRLRYRDRYVRETVYAFEGEYFTGLDNRPQSLLAQLQGEAENLHGTRIWVNLNRYFERVPEIFDLPRNVLVPIGDYHWTNINLRFQTSPASILQPDITVECCSFYDGDGIKLDILLNFRPNRYFEFRPRYEAEFISLPGGSVDIHIFSLDAVINFTPDMQFALEMQYDNISEGFQLSGRYRWEYSPGNEIFIGVGQTALLPSVSRFQADTTLFSIRLGRTFQF